MSDSSEEEGTFVVVGAGKGSNPAAMTVTEGTTHKARARVVPSVPLPQRCQVSHQANTSHLLMLLMTCIEYLVQNLLFQQVPTMVRLMDTCFIVQISMH